MSIVRVDSRAMFFQLLFRHLDARFGIDLVTLHDVDVGNFLARVRIDLQVLDAMAGVLVDLVEAFFRNRKWPATNDWTGNKGKAQKAFPAGTWAIGILQRNRTRIQTVFR